MGGGRRQSARTGLPPGRAREPTGIPFTYSGVVPGPVFKDHRVVGHGGVIRRRHELTDHEGELLAPLIPRAVTGRPRVAGRQVVNGMVHKSCTGISWRQCPEAAGVCPPAQDQAGVLRSNPALRPWPT
ncbi:transposase [Streptomyces decoyicus]|uniref:transposase n=1 Tax=Streptomyces decoyicus TaxID=249567 RepID=UPI003645DC06